MRSPHSCGVGTKKTDGLTRLFFLIIRLIHYAPCIAMGHQANKKN